MKITTEAIIRRKRKITSPYKVTWGWNDESSFETIDEVLMFIRNNHLESFSVSHDDTDLTSVVISILGWLK